MVVQHSIKPLRMATWQQFSCFSRKMQMSAFLMRYDLSLQGNALRVSIVQIMFMYSIQCVVITCYAQLYSDSGSTGDSVVTCCCYICTFMGSVEIVTPNDSFYHINTLWFRGFGRLSLVIKYILEHLPLQHLVKCTYHNYSSGSTSHFQIACGEYVSH